jgi:hypothetical protein
VVGVYNVWKTVRIAPAAQAAQSGPIALSPPRIVPQAEG